MGPRPILRRLPIAAQPKATLPQTLLMLLPWYLGGTTQAIALAEVRHQPTPQKASHRMTCLALAVGAN